MTDFDELKESLERDYSTGDAVHKMITDELFEDIRVKEKKLENIVSNEFKRLIEIPNMIISPRKNKGEMPQILEYKVSYNKELKNFEIKITKMKLPNGKIMDDNKYASRTYGCPHDYTFPICGINGEVSNIVKEFKIKYNVRGIKNVNHNCFHEIKK